MSTRPIFAKEFYNDPFLFWETVKNPIWSFRDHDVSVTDQRTLTTLPSSYLDQWKRHFFFAQDQNLIAANRHLKDLEVQVQNPSSPELHALKQEIHRTGCLGAVGLRSNLDELDRKFKRGNEKSALTLTLLKVVNFVRKLLNLQPIEFYHYSPLNLNLLQERTIGPALELTPGDRLRSKYLPIIQNNSSFPLPAKLSPDNLQRVELGLLSKISFTLDQKKFILTYNKTTEKFVLSYLGTENDHSLGSMGRTESITLFSTPLDIVEKQPNGSTAPHRLQASAHYSSHTPWYNLFERSTSYQFRSGEIALMMNNEYTIPLSQGNLCLKFPSRTS
jgi:hypothetical protein